MSTYAFALPELGEGIEAGDVVNVLVAVGDAIVQDQAVLELETDKAVIEVPAPVSGIVRDVHVQAGDKAAVGQLIVTFETEATEDATVPPVQVADAAPAGAAPEAPAAPTPVPPSSGRSTRSAWPACASGSGSLRTASGT
jgi:pyruvate/2-oxoglutarate dehydrogenase complex dihydrolipoamide acyltransferase (E2) component